MKLRLWNWIIKLLPGLFYSFACYILIEPLAGLFFRWNYGQLSGVQRLMILLLLVEGILLGSRLRVISRDKYKYYLLIGVLLIDSLIFYLLGWPLKFFIPLTLVLLLLGFRFISYNTSLEFNQDFLKGIVLVVLMTALERTEVNIDLQQIIIFFLLGISLSVYFNQLKLNSNSSMNNHKSFLLTALGLGLLQLIISSVLIVPLNRSIFAGILRFIAVVYNYAVDLLLLIIKPLLWLLTPVINFLIWIWSFGSGRRPAESDGLPNYADQIILDVKKMAPDKDFRYLISYVLTFLLIVLLIYFIRNYLKEGRKEAEGFIESRESIFSYQELKNDFKAAWLSLKNRFRKKGSGLNNYQGFSPPVRIRKVYYLFLLKAAELIPYHSSQTPDEYAGVLLQGGYFEDRREEVKLLTSLYNQTRYGKLASQQDAVQAEETWRRISLVDREEN